ncbi:MAG: tetratricopeptide repeat protein [Bacteroidota bacterium]
MKVFLLLLLLAGSIGWAVYEYNNPPSEKSQYYESGLTSYNSGYYEDAEYYFNEAVDENPEDAMSLFYRGLSKLQQEDYASAIEDCKAAILLDYDLETMYYKYGLDKYESYISDNEENSQPIEIIDQSLEVPENPSADEYNDLGLVEYKLDNYEKAILYFKKALEYDQSYKYSIYNLGLCYYALENYEEAALRYTQVIEIDPLYEDAYFNRAYIKYENENYEGALEDYDAFIRLNSNDASSFRNRGLAKYKLDDSEGACKDWEKAKLLGGNVSDLTSKYCI